MFSGEKQAERGREAGGVGVGVEGRGKRMLDEPELPPTTCGIHSTRGENGRSSGPTSLVFGLGPLDAFLY
jgi:hypothetical protein